jgi:SRSO17 transposase
MQRGPVHYGIIVFLIMPCERKSVEPMAAVTAPDRTAAQHQSLLHFVGQSPWSNEKVLAKVAEMVLPAIERHGPIEAWIIDDTGFPKKGRHSVGVARQYCGQLGKQDNCQVAVSLSLANHRASLPVDWHLYLPKEWAADHQRRRKVDVPDEIDFKTIETGSNSLGAFLDDRGGKNGRRGGPVASQVVLLRGDLAWTS